MVMHVKLFRQIFVLNPLWVVLTLTAFAILINLSWWQYSRAGQKQMQLQHLAQLQQSGPLSAGELQALATADADGILLQDDATWLRPYIWLLDNQIVDGKVGYDVVIPVSVSGLSDALLVNLGWIAAAPSRDQLPLPELTSQIQLDGLLRTSVDGLPLLGQNIEATGQWPVRAQQVDYAAFSDMIGRTVYPALLYQHGGTVLLPHYKSVVLPPEKHRGYALQWLLLAVAVIGVALAASHTGSTQDE